MTVDADRVFERVQACLSNLAGGSGHLASYRLDRDSFTVVARRPVEDGLTAYDFAVAGVRISEFDGPATSGDDDVAPGVDVDSPEHLEGTVVLDADGDLVTDESGRVRIHPWRTLDPARWSRRTDGLDDLLTDLDSDLD